MGIARGTNIVRDGLVFGYDTGYGLDNFKPTRFYKGKPATNMLSYGDSFTNWNKAKNSGSDPTVTSNVAAGPFENTLADKLSLPNDGSYPRLYQYFTPASTATHTFSVWLKAQSPNQGVFVGAFRNSPWALPSSTSFTITDEWVNYTFAVNPADTSSHQIYIGSHDSHKGKEFLIYGAQLETGSSRSTFVDGTRSDTASLIDLKRTTNIDVSNASFDSTGQPDLDGTGDYIKATTTHSITSDVTLEAVFNEETASAPHTTTICTDTGHQYGVKLMSYKNSNRYGLWLGFGTSSYVAMVSGTLNNNTIYHLVGSWDQSSGVVKIYLNGVLKSTISTGQTSAVSLNEAKVVVGADYHSLSYGLNGKVYVGKVYNKVLTDVEVIQNYKAYKNRFNL
jgi:hypothetical protein